MRLLNISVWFSTKVLFNYEWMNELSLLLSFYRFIISISTAPWRDLISRTGWAPNVEIDTVKQNLRFNEILIIYREFFFVAWQVPEWAQLLRCILINRKSHVYNNYHNYYFRCFWEEVSKVPSKLKNYFSEKLLKWSDDEHSFHLTNRPQIHCKKKLQKTFTNIFIFRKMHMDHYFSKLQNQNLSIKFIRSSSGCRKKWIWSKHDACWSTNHAHPW